MRSGVDVIKKGVERKNDVAIDGAFKVAAGLLRAIDRKDAKATALLARALKIMIKELHDSGKVNISR